MIVTTLLFNRPDLLQLQVEAVRRFCWTPHEIVVGIHAGRKVETDARRRLGDSVHWIKVDDGEMNAKDALSGLLWNLPPAATTLFMENDVLPFRHFGIDSTGPNFACRSWYGRQHQAWAVWRNGTAPTFSARADILIPSMTIKTQADVPAEFAGLNYYVHHEAGGEVIAGDFWHYERAGMGPMPRHVVEGKDGFVWRLADSWGIDLDECWAEIAREATPEELERHRIAVEAAKANRPQPASPPTERRPCSGCGGEKFHPPTTPDAAEQILREHIQ